MKIERDEHGAHIFLKGHFPENMIPYIPDFIEYRIKDSILIRFALRALNPFKSNTQLDWYANFLAIEDKSYNAQVKAYETQMKKHLPECEGFTILTVDFEFMERGKVELDLVDQLERAILVKNSHPAGTVKVYMGIDPRRPELIKLVNKYIHQIDGFKMYLYNGFFPYDPYLKTVYEIAEQYNLEVLFHCSNTNINYYGGKDINELLKASKFPLLPNRKGNKELSTNFCNPLGIVHVAWMNPNVNFRIAHFGGDDMISDYIKGNNMYSNYTAVIIDSLRFMNNVTTDFAFICNNRKSMIFLSNLCIEYPEIQNKIKFGLDYYMIETAGGISVAADNIREFQIRLFCSNYIINNYKEKLTISPIMVAQELNLNIDLVYEKMLMIEYLNARVNLGTYNSFLINYKEFDKLRN